MVVVSQFEKDDCFVQIYMQTLKLSLMMIMMKEKKEEEKEEVEEEETGEKKEERTESLFRGTCIC